MAHTWLWTSAGILLLFKLYYKVTTGRCHSKTRLNGRTAIVTGGNSGIGRETARDLARRGARVILACRNIKKAEEVRDDIIRTTGNRNVEVRALDLTSFASVRAFAHSILESEPALHILINNAGITGNNGKRTKDGVELTIQINHLGHFLLTNLLLDLLKKSAPSRIVFVSSLAHTLYDHKEPEEMLRPPPGPHNHLKTYSQTKLLNVLTAAHLARMLEGTGVTANSLHPGAVYTEIWEKTAPWVRYLSRIIVGTFMKDSKEGAETTIYLAVSEEVENVSGKYFSDCKLATPSKQAEDVALAQRVWDNSCVIVGLPDLIAQSRL